MNHIEYIEAKQKVEAYNAAADQYMAQNKTRGIPVEITATFPYANEVTNELRSSIEVYDFVNNQPAKYFLYIDEKNKTATTWMGDVLGSVTFGRSYRSNMNDIRVPVRITAINGKTYSGTYFKSAGDYARIKALKQTVTGTV